MNQLLKGMLFLLAACLLVATSLQAATINWKTTPVDTNFNNPNNWVGDVAPGSADSARILVIANYPVITTGTTVAVNDMLIGADLPGVVPTAPGEVDMTGGSVTVTTNFRVGGAAGESYLKISGGTFTKAGGGNSPRIGYVETPPAGYNAVGHLELSNGAVFNAHRNNFSVGLNTGATGYLTMNNATANFNQQYNTTGWQWILWVGNSGGTGIMDMTDSHVTQYGSSVQVGQGSGTGGGSNGTLNMMGASTMVIKPVNDPTIAGSALFIGVNGGANGTVNMHDTSSVSVPFGALSCGNATGTGLLRMYDNTTMTCDAGEVGVGSGTGTVELYGHSALTVTSVSSGFSIGGNSGTGTVTLFDSSVLTTPVVYIGRNAGNQGNGIGTLAFDGGTLKASANTTNFINTNGAYSATISVCDNGGTIDVGSDSLSQPLTVVIDAAIALSHGGVAAIDGGLTKTGVGKLLYNGNADYYGDTRVNGGILGGIGYLANSKIVLGSGGALQPGDPATIPSSLAAKELDATAGGTIINTIDCLGGSSNYLALTGPAVLTGTHFAPSFINGTPNGTYTLITGPSITSSGLVLDVSTMIPNTRLTLSLDATSFAVYLNASGEPLTDTWTGAVSGVWEANGALNWSNGTDTKFMNWDHVVFDSSDNRPNVTLNSHVYVPDMSFSGAKNYVISGTGKITGLSDALGVALTTAGTGSVDFQTNGNVFNALNINGGAATFTGATTFVNSTLNLSNNGSVDFKANAASFPTITASSGQINGTASLTSPMLTMSGAGGNLVISHSAMTVDWMNLGPGTITLNGAGNLTVVGHPGDLQVGPGTNSPAKLSLNDNSVFSVGQGNITVGTNGGDGTLEMTGSSTFRHLNNGDGWLVLYVGVHANSTATVTMTGGTSTTPGSLIDMGPEGGPITVGNDGGQATLTMSQYSKITCGQFTVGVGKETVASVDYFGNGTLKMYDHSSINSSTGWMLIGNVGTGSVELNDNASINVAQAISVGDGGGGIGSATLNGNSTLTAHGGIWVGNETTSSGELNVYGNATVNSVEVELEVPFWGTGVLNVGDGNAAHNAVVSCQQIGMGYDSRSISGTVNLNAGGTINTNNIYTATDGTNALQSIVNFNGGTLRATANQAKFITNEGAVLDFQLNVLAGGAKIDSAGFNIKITEPLTGSVGDGGLSKLGGGTLLLTAAPTYTGNTDIQNGTLQLAVPGTVSLTTITGSATGTLSVCDGTTLTATSIQVGTLSIGGSPIVISAATVAVPEPSTLILLVLAGIGLLFQARRKARA